MITDKRDVCSAAWTSRRLPVTLWGAGSAGQRDASLSAYRHTWSVWCEPTVTQHTGSCAVFKSSDEERRVDGDDKMSTFGNISNWKVPPVKRWCVRIRFSFILVQVAVALLCYLNLMLPSYDSTFSFKGIDIYSTYLLFHRMKVLWHSQSLYVFVHVLQKASTWARSLTMIVITSHRS